MEENERQKSTAWPWHINGASEAGRRRRGGLYSAAAPQWADTGECRRHTAIPPPPAHTLTLLIGAEMAAVRQAISTADDSRT